VIGECGIEHYVEEIDLALYSVIIPEFAFMK
jgi:hypothetical protein